MRGSIAVALPANARPSSEKPEKTPKRSFMLKRLKAVLRWMVRMVVHATIMLEWLPVCLRNSTVLRPHRVDLKMQRPVVRLGALSVLGINAFVATKTLPRSPLEMQKHRRSAISKLLLDTSRLGSGASENSSKNEKSEKNSSHRHYSQLVESHFIRITRNRKLSPARPTASAEPASRRAPAS